jgi:hypothetical protein
MHSIGEGKLIINAPAHQRSYEFPPQVLPWEGGGTRFDFLFGKFNPHRYPYIVCRKKCFEKDGIWSFFANNVAQLGLPNKWSGDRLIVESIPHLNTEKGRKFERALNRG